MRAASIDDSQPAGCPTASRTSLHACRNSASPRRAPLLRWETLHRSLRSVRLRHLSRAFTQAAGAKFVASPQKRAHVATARLRGLCILVTVGAWLALSPAAMTHAQRRPQPRPPQTWLGEVDVELDEGEEPRDLPPGLRRAAEDGDREFERDSADDSDDGGEREDPELSSRAQPSISLADQREATRAFERLMRSSRGRRNAAARRALADQLHAYALRYPGAAEAPVAIGHEGTLLTQDVSRTTPEAAVEATLRRVDALGELPGAPVDELGRTLEQTISAAYRRRPMPEALIARLVARYGDVMDGIALRLREQREREDAEVAIARDPEALRERARARAELNRCIDECLNFEDVCTGYRQRVIVSSGGRLYIQRQRVTTRCGARLEDCQMECGMAEDDPEYVGED